MRNTTFVMTLCLVSIAHVGLSANILFSKFLDNHGNATNLELVEVNNSNDVIGKVINYNDASQMAEDCSCTNGKCVEVNGTFKCTCPPEYGVYGSYTFRTYEEECRPCKCGKESNCTFTGGFWRATINCICKQGYKVENKKCQECDCGPNGKCSFDATFEEKCECDMDYAINNEGICQVCYCGAEATDCQFIGGIKKCKCKSTASEKYGLCEVCNCGMQAIGCKFSGSVKKCECRPHAAEYNGKCENIDETTVAEVTASEEKPSPIVNEITETMEWTKESTKTITISTLIPGTCFRSRDCLNGGVCRRSEGGAKFCRCKPYFRGDRCETSELCDRLKLNCEAIGAQCRAIGTTVSCECPPEKAYSPETRRCQDICDFDKCLNGICLIMGKSYKCKCDEGFAGKRCDERKIKHPGNTYLWIACVALFSVSTIYFIVNVCYYCKSKNVISIYN